MKKFSIPLADTMLLLGLVLLFSFFDRGSGNVEPIIDVVLLNADGAVYWNGEEIEQFTEEHIEYTFGVEIAERLHHKFRSEARGDLVHLKIDGQSLIGWNNRLLAVVYGLVDFELCSWKTLSYQVDQEKAVVVEVGLYRRARQITAELLDEEELDPGEFQPFLFLTPENAELPLGEKCLDQGICFAVTHGDHYPLKKARKWMRDMFGPKAQIGFEQRIEAVAEYLPRMDEATINAQCDAIRLTVDGRVSFNGKPLIKFDDEPYDYLKYRPLAQASSDRFKAEASKEKLLILADGGVLCGWLEHVKGWVWDAWKHTKTPWKQTIFQIVGEQPQKFDVDLTSSTRVVDFRIRDQGEGKLSIWNPGLTHTGTPRPEFGMSCLGQYGRAHTLMEARAQLRQVFGPQAEAGIPQRFQVVLEASDAGLTEPVE
ncbi:MAG: hypothetical protein HQ519_02285 [Planctomycetes bacterium]|nr:hypothetical protein [Planctomycetota bacterium]